MSSKFEMVTDFDEMDTGSIGGFDQYFGDEFEFEVTGVDPALPTVAKPGSEDKVETLAARYAAGLPLWHDSDCYDHGPGAVADDDEL